MGRNPQCISHLSINNHVEDLQLLQVWLKQIETTFRIHANLLFKMDLVLNEAVPNIIDYAFEDAGTHKIAIQLLKTAHGYALSIIDAGIPFNPLKQTYHDALTLEEAHINGRGIHLIKHFSDAQQYVREENNNVLTLFFNDEYARLPV